MNVSYHEINAVDVTFPAGTCAPGKVCKIGAAGKADLCSAGDRFCGVAHGLTGGCAAVQIHGFVTLPYSGSAPKTGHTKMTADGNGGVKADESGWAYLTAEVNTANKTVTFEL